MLQEFNVGMLALLIFPLVLILDFILGRLIRNRRRNAFEKLKKKGIGYLKSMSWQDFERFCALHFKAEGYKVEMCGLGGADGGMDLLLRKRWKTTLVQCKHWKAKVGVTTVREMFGVMHAHKFDNVIIVALSGYTKEAENWVGNKPIKLLSGPDLLKSI
ncbi:restriction endonuclease [Pseudomonas sp. PLMAX]|uniref:restriction endonuclease n=1 Tax=Pseudomonas sp. PLMAX TaxID=2201998 RepID=UPI0038BB97A2